MLSKLLLPPGGGQLICRCLVGSHALRRDFRISGISTLSSAKLKQGVQQAISKKKHCIHCIPCSMALWATIWRRESSGAFLNSIPRLAPHGPHPHFHPCSNAHASVFSSVNTSEALLASVFWQRCLAVDCRPTQREKLFETHHTSPMRFPYQTTNDEIDQNGFATSFAFLSARNKTKKNTK